MTLFAGRFASGSMEVWEWKGGHRMHEQTPEPDATGELTRWS